MEITLLNADTMEISPFNICVKCFKVGAVQLHAHFCHFELSYSFFCYICNNLFLPRLSMPVQIPTPHIAEMSQRQARACTRKQGGLRHVENLTFHRWYFLQSKISGKNVQICDFSTGGWVDIFIQRWQIQSKGFSLCALSP